LRLKKLFWELLGFALPSRREVDWSIFVVELADSIFIAPDKWDVINTQYIT